MLSTATVILALVAGAAVPAASGAVVGPRVRIVVSGVPEGCTTEARTEADAVGIAAVCGKNVEVLDARTEFDTLFAQADGTMRLVVSVAAVRTRVGADGRWRDIDTSIVPGEGRVEVAAPATEMSFSDGTPGEPLARITRGGHDLELDVPFALPSPTIAGDSVTYSEVLPGVDLIVRVNMDGTGFSEVLRVESAEAAAIPALAELALPLDVTDGLQVAQTAEGGFAAVDESGEAVFTAQPALMWDSSADSATALPSLPVAPGLAVALQAAAAAGNAQTRLQAPVKGDDVAVMGMAASSDEVTITPAVQMLTDPGTVWPVYIDPAVGSNSRTEWMAVRDSGGGVAHNFTVDEGVGFCNTAQITGGGFCNPYSFRSRLMWEFSGLSVLPDLEPSNLISAVFTANGTNAYSCTASAIQLYRVNDFTGATTFATSGPWTSDRLVQTHVTTHRPGCADVNARPRPIEFNVMPIATWAVSSDSTALWVGLKAGDETSMVGWKRYGYDATLSIVYNRPPSVPTDLQVREGLRSWACPAAANPTAPLAVAPGSVTVAAKLTDPDGGNLRGNFNIYDTNGNAWLNPPMTYGQPSGALHTVAVNPANQGPALVEGPTYFFDVDSTDDNPDRTLWSPKSQRCYFRIDSTAPEKPVVTRITDPVLLGQQVQFLVSSSSTDVAQFAYSLQGDAGSTVVDAVDGSVTVIASRTGLNWITVWAVDGAGNESVPADQVDFTVTPVLTDDWQLNENTGTSASNAVSGREPLVLNSGVAWTPGAGARDTGLLFDAIGDTAATPHSVVDTTESFTVSALVRLDTIATDPAIAAPNNKLSATAVSQDGTDVSGFSLGYRGGSACPSGCWSFFMYPSDVTTTPVQVAAPITVDTGGWVQLTGIYDAAKGEMRIHACEIGGARESAGATANFRSAWNATGPLRLNGGESFGIPARPFAGAVSSVRVFPAALAIDDPAILAGCQPPR